MGQVRDLVAMLPGMVMVKDADRFSERNLMVFDRELADPESVFAHREGDTDGWNQRLKVLELPEDMISDGKAGTYRYGMDLLAYVGLKHRERKGILSAVEEDQLSALFDDLVDRSLQPEAKPVEEVMTLEAASQVWWSQ